MPDEVIQLTPEYVRDLDAWTRAWFMEAAAAGYISPPYHADGATLEPIRGCFLAGLCPADAAEACFGRKH